jgi:hypothetical protein
MVVDASTVGSNVPQDTIICHTAPPFFPIHSTIEETKTMQERAAACVADVVSVSRFSIKSDINKLEDFDCEYERTNVWRCSKADTNQVLTFL